MPQGGQCVARRYERGLRHTVSGSLAPRYRGSLTRVSLFPFMGEVIGKADGQLLLIVDDQVFFSAFLREKFEELGYSVLTAEDAFGALELVSQFEAPLVVLLDLMLPLVSGHQLLRELAYGVHASTIRVILVSAHHTVETVATNHPMVVGRVQKPIDLGELTRIVNFATHDLASHASSREDVLRRGDRAPMTAVDA